jgi:hypothetical protein
MRAKYQASRGKDGVGAEQILTSGRYLGQGLQDIHEQSITQKYTIGARMVMDDRVFRYCQAKEALDAFLGGRADVMPREGAGDAVAYEVGDTVVSIPMNQYGPDYAAEQVEDYWAEGYYWSGVSTPTVGQMHRIKSSAAAAAGVTVLTGGYVQATLYEPLKYAIPASTWQTSWVNPYKTCKHEHSARMTVICQPLINVTINYYFWGQTWGPCFGQLYNTAIGRNDGDRTVFYMSDGSLASSKDVNYATAGNPLPQIAGFVISNTEAWTNQDNGAELGGDQFYMLQLSP